MDDIVVKADNTLTFKGNIYRCSFGKGGLKKDKTEGDGATPAGVFPVREVFYRADRVEKPETALPVRATKKEYCWSFDPNDPAYNTLIEKEGATPLEGLWRDDYVFNLVLVIGYNDNPVVPGKGSGIFIHLARPNYTSTMGCIHLNEKDLREVLAGVTKDTVVRIGVE